MNWSLIKVVDKEDNVWEQVFRSYKMSMINDKKYKSMRDNNYQFVMKSDYQSFVRGGKSLMIVAKKNYIFNKISNHMQISVKARIKKFEYLALVAMVREFNHLNSRVVLGKSAFGTAYKNTTYVV